MIINVIWGVISGWLDFINDYVYFNSLNLSLGCKLKIDIVINYHAGMFELL